MWMMRAVFRLVLAGLLMAAVGAVVIYGSWKLLHPFALQREQREEIAQLEKRVGQLKREQARLKETVGRLSTVRGKAEELRRMGYVGPKERIIRFIQDPRAQEPADRETHQPADQRGGVKNRIKQWLEARLGPAENG